MKIGYWGLLWVLFFIHELTVAEKTLQLDDHGQDMKAVDVYSLSTVS